MHPELYLNLKQGSFLVFWCRTTTRTTLGALLNFSNAPRKLEDTQTSMNAEPGRNPCFVTLWPMPTVAVAFQVSQACWGAPHDAPLQTNCRTPPPLCIRTLHVKGKVTGRQRRQRPVNSKGMNYEIFMSVYPVQSLQQSISHPVILWCKRHSQVSGHLITQTLEDPDIPVNQVLSLILNENFVLLISFTVRSLYGSFRTAK